MKKFLFAFFLFLQSLGGKPVADAIAEIPAEVRIVPDHNNDVRTIPTSQKVRERAVFLSQIFDLNGTELLSAKGSGYDHA